MRITRSEIGEEGKEEEMKRDAKASSLEQALNEQKEKFYVEEVRDHLFAGDRRGLDRAGLSTRGVGALEDEVATREEGITSRREEITAQKVGITSLKEKLNSHKIKISSLEDPTTSLDAHKLVRNRFISTFKRDKLANATEADRRIIAEGGNGWAHGGDAIADAKLYQGMAGRRDFRAFEKLYGMDPSIVLRIVRMETINVLNTHATVIASDYQTGSDRFYTLFAEFVRLFKESDYDEGFLDRHATRRDVVALAYWRFLNCIKYEVARAEEAAEPI